MKTSVFVLFNSHLLSEKNLKFVFILFQVFQVYHFFFKFLKNLIGIRKLCERKNKLNNETENFYFDFFFPSKS